MTEQNLTGSLHRFGHTNLPGGYILCSFLSPFSLSYIPPGLLCRASTIGLIIHLTIHRNCGDSPITGWSTRLVAGKITLVTGDPDIMGAWFVSINLLLLSWRLL
jgi:hypothetical protein